MWSTSTPRDDTSGCTAQAKDFSCQLEAFKSAGAYVIGISPDSAKSHGKFKLKHELSLTLAADEEKSAANAYGVWMEKSMYGRKYMGVDRSTFLIDAKGRIAKIWRKVKVPGHVAEVLDAVKAPENLDRTDQFDEQYRILSEVLTLSVKVHDRFWEP